MVKKKNQLLKNIFSLGTVQLVNYVFPLITVPYVSRIIGPDSYGIIHYATAFVGYFSLLIGYGFDLTATRRITKNSGDNHYVSHIFSQVVNARILLFLVSCVLFSISIFSVAPLQQDSYVAIMLFVSTISIVLIPQYIYQGKQDLTIFAVLNFIRGAINTVLVFILIKEKNDYIILPTLSSIIAILSALFLLVYAYKKYHLKFHWIPIKKTIRLLIDERLIFFSTIVISLYTTTNTVVLGFFVSATDVGLFTVSLNLLNIINSVTNIPISTSLYPYVGTAFSKGRNAGLEVLKKIFPIVGYLTFFACIVLFLLAPLIINIFYGNKFQGSIIAFRILAFMPFIVSMSNIFGIQTMLNLGMDKIFLKATATASVIGVLLNLAMSKLYGYTGTAWSTIIIELFVTLYMYFLLRKNNISVIEKKYFSLNYTINVIKSLVKKEVDL